MIWLVDETGKTIELWQDIPCVTDYFITLKRSSKIFRERLDKNSIEERTDSRMYISKTGNDLDIGRLLIVHETHGSLLRVIRMCKTSFAHPWKSSASATHKARMQRSVAISKPYASVEG